MKGSYVAVFGFFLFGSYAGAGINLESKDHKYQIRVADNDQITVITCSLAGENCTTVALGTVETLRKVMYDEISKDDPSAIIGDLRRQIQAKESSKQIYEVDYANTNLTDAQRAEARRRADALTTEINALLRQIEVQQPLIQRRQERDTLLNQVISERILGPFADYRDEYKILREALNELYSPGYYGVSCTARFHYYDEVCEYRGSYLGYACRTVHESRVESFPGKTESDAYSQIYSYVARYGGGFDQVHCHTTGTVLRRDRMLIDAPSTFYSAKEIAQTFSIWAIRDSWFLPEVEDRNYPGEQIICDERNHRIMVRDDTCTGGFFSELTVGGPCPNDATYDGRLTYYRSNRVGMSVNPTDIPTVSATWRCRRH